MQRHFCWAENRSCQRKRQGWKVLPCPMKVWSLSCIFSTVILPQSVLIWHCSSIHRNLGRYWYLSPNVVLCWLPKGPKHLLKRINERCAQGLPGISLVKGFMPTLSLWIFTSTLRGCLAWGETYRWDQYCVLDSTYGDVPAKISAQPTKLIL